MLQALASLYLYLFQQVTRLLKIFASAKGPNREFLLRRGDKVTRGSEAALRLYAEELGAFAARYRPQHPQWFREIPPSLSMAYIVGMLENPGVALRASLEKIATKRIKIIMDALEENNFDPIPGFTTFCNE